MAEEVGVAFVRLVPSMRGFGPEAQRALNDGLQGPARAAGQQAGRDAGEGAGSRFGGAFKGAMLGAGVLAGAALIGGVTEALDQGRIVGKLRAQLGATPAEAERFGKIAGDLYAGAIVGSFQEGADTIRGVMAEGLLPPDATNKQIKDISTGVADLANTFDFDLGEAATAVGQLIKSKMAPDAKTGLDLIAAGLEGTGKRADDALETITEYAPIFETAGISGKTAMGLIRQGLQAGAKDTDKIADAFKELNLVVTSGSTASQDALKSLGLDARQVMDDMAAGGKRGEEAMDLVLDTMSDLGPNTTTVKQAVQDLFGGPGEDLGADLFALDVDKASDSMDGATGAADRLGDGLRDNAGAKLTQFKRRLEQNLVEFLGGEVIPALEDFGGVVGKTFGGIWSEAGKGSDGTVDRIINVFAILGQRLGEKIAELAPKAVEGLLGLGGKIAAFVTANPEKVFKIGLIAAALILAIVSLPLLVGAAISASAALMMIGFVKRLISSLGENLPKWWASFTGWVGDKASAAGRVFNVVGAAIGRWFGSLWSRYISGPVSRQWNSFVTTVRGLPGRSVSALSALGGNLSSASSKAWQRFRNAAAIKVDTFVTWVRGIPGRARRALGNLGGVLAAAGRSLISGFISGIKEKFGDVRSTLGDLTGSLTSWKGPEDVDRKILTPAGRLLISGFQRGIDLQTPSLRSQLQSLTGTLPAAATSGLPAAAAAGRAPAAAAGTTVVIDGTNMPKAIEEWLRHNTRIHGSVDSWLNQSAG